MKAFVILLITTALAVSGLSAKPFVPMTEEQEGELRRLLSIIQAAAVETKGKLDDTTAKLSEAGAQLNLAADDLSAAQLDIADVQNNLDAANDTIAEQKAEIARLHRQWWWMFFTIIGEGVVIAALVFYIVK